MSGLDEHAVEIAYTGQEQPLSCDAADAAAKHSVLVVCDHCMQRQ